MPAMQTTSKPVASRKCLFQRDIHSGMCRAMDLTSVPRDLPIDTEILDLSINKITTLYKTSFSPYKQLEVLIIRSNGISFIDSGTFLKMSFLQSLDLSDNGRLPVLRGDMFVNAALANIQKNRTNLAHVPDNIFKAMIVPATLGLRDNALRNISWTDCHNVAFHIVSLSDNNFTELSEQSFVMDYRVDLLDLSYNPIRFVSPATIPSLRVEGLDMSGILLPEEELQHLLEGARSSSSITYLYIRDMGLTSLRPGLFGALQGKYLRKLDLGINELRQLIPRGFENLTDVYNLALNSNWLEAIEPSHFSGMSSLRVLSMVGNRVSSINLDNHVWKTNLTTLYLGLNAFARIGTRAFNGLKNLEFSDLSNNNLDPLSHVVLSDLISLNYLSLTKCSISVAFQLNAPSLIVLDFWGAEGIPPDMVAPGAFKNYTPLLQEISFEKTGIHVFDLWDDKNSMSSFEGLRDLRVLNLAGTNMFYMPTDFFQNLPTLQVLYLNGCDILSSILPVFNGLFSLQILSLAGNELRYILGDIFKDTIQLRELSLASNNLNFLKADLFQHLVNLTRLNLSFNKLVTLQFTTFEPILHTILELELEYNQWACNCSLKWLPKWVAQRSIKLEYSLATRCSHEGSFKSAAGKLLIEFNPIRECGPQYVLYFSLVASAAFVTLGLIVIYYNRWKIRYGLFLCKIHFIGYREIIPREQREDFKYDMYIVTHDADEEWTDRIFIRGMEENLPEYGRLAIGDEALQLGMYYLDSVNLLVENSFKVIFLISENALRDHMFLLKFRLALDHVNEVQMEKIVLVFREEIPDADLPFLIRLFLSDNRAYLMWPRDLEGQPYFWEQLAKYMIFNRYCNPLVPP
ncbi:LOW QUALITY PROTEIN: toll-like receptor 3 [Diadema setosum]|uniref:LOW QUALITY PROTEIN: toll-like receptor 3 n=1 Tax=Diadema setosum TaxID=31175 RepID=UPI003B3BCE04